VYLGVLIRRQEIGVSQPRPISGLASFLIGVLLGSATTVIVTVYQERWVSVREREARQHQREQDRKDQRDTFQRQSLLALQGPAA
jgi:cell division protein FtsL